MGFSILFLNSDWSDPDQIFALRRQDHHLILPQIQHQSNRTHKIESNRRLGNKHESEEIIKHRSETGNNIEPVPICSEPRRENYGNGTRFHKIQNIEKNKNC